MDEPVPVRRAVIGCVTIAALVVLVILLVRPTLFTLAPPRDDAATIVAAASEVGAEPIRRDVILTRSFGWDGELDAGDGRVQLSVWVSRGPNGEVSAVNAASPASEPGEPCAVDVEGDRLADCEGSTWTFAGQPIDPGAAPLERFPVTEEGGSVTVDFTRTGGVGRPANHGGVS